MRPAGALVDRLGPGLLPIVVGVYAGTAVLPALATSAIALAGALLLLLGAASGEVGVAVVAALLAAAARFAPVPAPRASCSRTRRRTG